MIYTGFYFPAADFTELWPLLISHYNFHWW